MQAYCERCQLTFSGTRCPICGERKVREPLPDDLCYLCEKQILWGEMLEEVLKDNGIPVVLKKKMGIGLALKVGPMMERVRVYVPYAHLQDSEQIVNALFSETEGGDEV